MRFKMDEDNTTKKHSIAERIKAFGNEIWSVPSDSERGLRRTLIILSRIIFAVVNGIVKKRILVQASSLSYATLLAVGPILAITIMFSQLFFRDKDEAFLYDKIMDAAIFVMPAFNEMLKEEAASATERSEYESGGLRDTRHRQPGAISSRGDVNDRLLPGRSNGADKAAVGKKAKRGNDSAGGVVPGEVEGADAPSAARGGHYARTIDVNPQIYQFIENISKGSARAGILGVIAMLFTCLLLFVNMESAFNYIWGVEQGRKWVNRVVFYFVMIFFGSAGSIFAAGFFATSTLSRIFGDLPFFKEYLPWISYCLGVAVMLLVLSCFYKFIPFTKVAWKSALVGGAVVTVLLLLNNRLSFLYMAYIAKQQSFYGYLAIVVIAMFSLYIFWTFLLSGGIIAYSFQFVGFYDDAQAWNKIGSRSKNLCGLAVFCEVSREFYNKGSGAKNLDELSARLKLPTALLAMCVKWLVEKELVCFAESASGDETLLKPAISPDSITIMQLLDTLAINDGDQHVFDRLSDYENAVKISLSAFEQISQNEILSKRLRDIL